MNTKTLLKRIGFLILLLVVGVSIGISAKRAFADAALWSSRGFLWGGGVTVNPSNYGGMGWMSLNSVDCDTNDNGTIDASEAAAHSGCPIGSTGSYGVNIPNFGGALSGYAWSDGYGWISFNPADLDGCFPNLLPATRTGGSVSGGARIVSIHDAVTIGDAGGYDGCISLSGTATDGSPYGVSVAGTGFAGYAWSSDLGWIDFGSATYVPTAFLVVCEDAGGVFGKRNDESNASPVNTSIPRKSTAYLKAFMNTSSDCTGTDVTNLATWTKTSDPSGVLTVGNTANTDKGHATASATADNTSSSASIQVQYDSGVFGIRTVPVTVTFSCTENVCDGMAATYCAGKPYTETAPGFCGGNVTCSGTGTKICGMGNMKEVAP